MEDPKEGDHYEEVVGDHEEIPVLAAHCVQAENEHHQNREP